MPPQRIPRQLPPPEASHDSRTIADSIRLEKQKTLAKGRLERAFQLRFDGDEHGARQALAEAVRIDPTLITNSTVISLAQALTNQPRDEAVLDLLDYSENVVVVSRPAFVISRQGYILIAACVLLFSATVAVSSAFFMLIAPVANPLLLRAGVLAVNAARLDQTLRPMAAAPTWPIINTAIVLTIVIVVSVTGSYVIGHLLGGAGSVSRYLSGQFYPYAIMFGLMAAGLVLIRTAGSAPPPATGFDWNFSLGVWLFEAALPGTLIVNSVIASRIQAITVVRGLAAVLICTAVLVALFGILAGFTLIPHM